MPPRLNDPTCDEESPGTDAQMKHDAPAVDHSLGAFFQQSREGQISGDIAEDSVVENVLSDPKNEDAKKTRGSQKQGHQLASCHRTHEETDREMTDAHERYPQVATRQGGKM